jgi:hypothetical protein
MIVNLWGCLNHKRSVEFDSILEDEILFLKGSYLKIFFLYCLISQSSLFSLDFLKFASDVYKADPENE